MTQQHTQRFSNRVETYIRSRPGYPEALLRTLERECGAAPSWPVADIGSGTGILSEMLLKNGYAVWGIEPNAEMRDASAKLLAEYPRFRAVDGSAEATGLGPASVRLITAAQAFHWFDQAKARQEFLRITHPGAVLAIIFNTRKVGENPFGQAYEELVKKYGSGAGYGDLRHENLGPADFEAFFGSGGCAHVAMSNEQHFDLEGLKGRMASMSWVPLPGDPRFDPMMRDVEALFARFQTGGRVVFEYVAEMHYGRFPNG
jgi:SAM-dependent methyltransferase